MIVRNLVDVVNWADRQSGDEPWHSDPFLAGRIGEDIASVVVRNAFGQGLKYGDDWGWILEMYGPEECRKIAKESILAARGRRR